MEENQTFYKVLDIVNSMVDAKEISEQDLITIFKYGCKKINPNDCEEATEVEKESWNRSMFCLERRCREREIIKIPDTERQPCEIWTRVMGYFRPASEFNQGKKTEFAERKYFTEEKIHNED